MPTNNSIRIFARTNKKLSRKFGNSETYYWEKTSDGNKAIKATRNINSLDLDISSELIE